MNYMYIILKIRKENIMDTAMQTIFNSAISWLIPLVLSGIIGTLVKIYKDSIAMKKGLLAMIRSELNKECEKYLKTNAGAHASKPPAYPTHPMTKVSAKL